jgi:elongation factor P
MANIPLKRGMLIRHQNRLFTVEDFNERHTGKQKPTVHVTLRDIRDGHSADRTLDDLLPIQAVEHQHRTMQYLYARGPSRVFMDSETFEELELGPAHLHGCEPFLVEGEQYRVMFADGQPIMLEMPEIVSIKVKMTAAPGHSVGTAANITKEATLENGLEVRVPLFIKTGDVIRIDTRTKTYAGKEHA